MKRSRVLSAGGDPFLKKATGANDGAEILGPNSFVRIKKS